ncbi:conserved protein of unknown function [Ectopseudomonas oleovorans]|uniref:Uncharacterized protein n=1 Tax=Ectopseudomonas oleovorans TaxID=301 RepID=A0A653B0F2_ECTOL|nr:conserved protein of unknown function [Pseudomonas oleovorans]
MSNQEELIGSFDGPLNGDQVAQLLGLGDEGDTSDALEDGGEPGAATDAADDAGAQQGQEAGNEGVTEEQLDGLNSDNAVVMAKDGKHTIDFSVLADQRAKARAAEQELLSERERRETAEAELEALRADAQARKDAGEAATAADKNLEAAQAAIDAGIDPAVFGDFSEESLIKGVSAIAERLADQKTQSIREEMQELKKLVEPMQHRHVEDAGKAHFDAILAAHPDVESIAESKELADWIASQPSFAQAGYKAVLASGTAQEVIEAIDAFKAATGMAQEQKPDLQAAAKAVVDKAKAEPPASLSDFAGARTGPATTNEAMASMDGVGLINAMDGWSQEQIERYLNGL